MGGKTDLILWPPESEKCVLFELDGRMDGRMDGKKQIKEDV